MDLQPWEQTFITTLQDNGVSLSEQQCMQFKEYATLLVEWNQKMNLTAITKIEEIYSKHFLDCILPSFTLTLEGHLCDVGAGAGFPSIPLKIVYPDLAVTIVEPLQKRCTFLHALVKALGLENVTIANARAEEYVKEHREAYDVVSARAVANLTMLAELCIPLVKESGIFLAMKGSGGEEELDKAKFAIQTLGCELVDTHKYALEEAMRINFVFKKNKATPKRYPRMFAKIKKDPLVR